MMRFNVTYDIVTFESAEHGDVAEQGFEAKNCSLRAVHPPRAITAASYGRLRRIFV